MFSNLPPKWSQFTSSKLVSGTLATVSVNSMTITVQIIINDMLWCNLPLYLMYWSKMSKWRHLTVDNMIILTIPTIIVIMMIVTWQAGWFVIAMWLRIETCKWGDTTVSCDILFNGLMVLLYESLGKILLELSLIKIVTNRNYYLLYLAKYLLVIFLQQLVPYPMG